MPLIPSELGKTQRERTIVIVHLVKDEDNGVNLCNGKRYHEQRADLYRFCGECQRIVREYIAKGK